MKPSTNPTDKQIRTCIATNEKHNKADMIRIVSFRGENLQLDLTGKAPGRGCYVSAKAENLDKLIERNGSLLARAFKKKINPEEIEYLMAQFPKTVEEKLFRPRVSKPVVVRVTKDDWKQMAK